MTSPLATVDLWCEYYAARKLILTPYCQSKQRLEYSWKDEIFLVVEVEGKMLKGLTITRATKTFVKNYEQAGAELGQAQTSFS